MDLDKTCDVLNHCECIKVNGKYNLNNMLFVANDYLDIIHSKRDELVCKIFVRKVELEKLTLELEGVDKILKSFD